MPLRSRPMALLLLATLAAPAAPAAARDLKTVFHGMPVEPDTGFLRPPEVRQVTLDPVWIFGGFIAPLAGEAADAGTHLVASDRSGRTVSIEVATGAAAWTTELGDALSIGPAVLGDLVLQGTSSGILVALDLADGRERWRAPIGAPPATLPIAEAGRLLVATAAPELVSIDPRDGRVLSRLALPGAPFAPATGPAGVVIGTASGKVVAAGGEPLVAQWTRDLEHAITGPALLDDKRVLVPTDDRALWALRAKSGRTSWKQRVGSRVTARPRVVGDLLYVPCWDNDVYVMGRKNGHILGRARLGHRLSGETTILGEHLFVAPATEGSVVALELPYLGVAGKSELEEPGEWFTTAPVAAAALPGVAVGWGRTTGRLVALQVSEAPPPVSGTDDSPAP